MSLRLPPGPRDRAFGLRTVARIKRDILGFYRQLHRDYGDCVYARLGPYHDYCFFHPDQVHKVLVERAKAFVKMPRLTRVLRQWNGDGLLITEGDTRLRQRRLAQPAFHRDRFAGYADVMAAAAHDHLARLSGEIDFGRLATEITTDIITRTTFGAGLDAGERAELREAVHVLNDMVLREMTAAVTLPDGLPLPEKGANRRAVRVRDTAVRKMIRARRVGSADAGDLLSMLLLAVDAEGDGKGLTDEEARDQRVNIFLAGHDTTAAGLTWVGWALAAHPAVAARAAQEVSEALGDRAPGYADLPKLKYLERVVKEALRHHPPAIGALARLATADTEIGGWVVPKGAIVRVRSWVTHHDPRWYPEPDAFDPDRFDPGRVETRPPGAYFLFGLDRAGASGASSR